MVCRQGRGLCGMDVSGHTQDEVGMCGEIPSPEALMVRPWQDLMQVQPLRSHGALNSKRTCACFSALPYLLHQTTHIPFCSPSSDSSSHLHSMHSWYPLIMSSSNTRSCQINLSNISCDARILSPPHPPPTQVWTWIFFFLNYSYSLLSGLPAPQWTVQRMSYPTGAKSLSEVD